MDYRQPQTAKPQTVPVAKVTTGSTIVAKESFGKKMGRWVTRGFQAALTEIIIPAALKTAADGMKKAVDAWIPAESYSKVNKGRVQASTNAYVGNISYRSYWDAPAYQQRTYSPAFDFTLIQYETAEDAEKVLYELRKIISEKTRATVGDLYDLSGLLVDGQYPVYNYAWTSLPVNLEPRQVPGLEDRYWLPLPQPLPIRNV